MDETSDLLLDALYERVSEAAQVVDCAVFVAVGVTASGHRRVLDLSVTLLEAEVHWRAFLDSLIKRGYMGSSSLPVHDQWGGATEKGDQTTNAGRQLVSKLRELSATGQCHPG